MMKNHSTTTQKDKNLCWSSSSKILKKNFFQYKPQPQPRFHINPEKKSSMTHYMTCCVLCGDPEQVHTGHCILVKNVQDFLSNHVKPSPFHYQAVMSIPVSEHTLKTRICRHCINWKRHITSHHRATHKFYSPMDHIIFHLLEPGSIQEPDHRCLKRLIHAAHHVGNLFRNVVPIPCQEIIKECVAYQGHQLPEQVIMSWWRVNGYTHFFRNRATSKMVRRALRQQKLHESQTPGERAMRVRWRH